MNKTIAVFAVVAAVLLAAPTADAAPELRKFGFGVNAGTNLGFAVPINLTPTFRIEPLLTIINSKTTTKPQGGDEGTSGSSTIAAGVGAYSLMRTEGPYLRYVGGRVGAVLGSTSPKQGDDEITESWTDIFIAGALGSEYFFNPRFSLGAEISVNVIMGGDHETDPNDDETDSTSLTIATSGDIKARFYF